MKRPSRSQMTLLAVFGLFLLPVVAAIVLRSYPALLGDLHTTQHGDLVDPPLRVSASAWQVISVPPDGNPPQLQTLWTALLISDAECGAVCRQRLHDLQQVHIALNKDIDRLQRILLVTTAGTPAVEAAPGLSVMRVAPGWAGSTGPLPGALAPGHVYLVDPRGYLFMHYAPDIAAGDLLKDLKRLLRISKVG